MKSHTTLTAPDDAVGITQVWSPGEGQLRIDDRQAAILAYMGYIVYSPEDGPNARVYRVAEGHTYNEVKEATGG